MISTTRICIAGMLLVCAGWAQEKSTAGTVTPPVVTKANSAVPPSAKAQPKKKSPAKKNLTQDEQVAVDLLESSLAKSAKLDAISQGQVRLEQSRLYWRHFADKDKAASLLDEGFQRVISVRDEQPTRLEHVRTMVEGRLLGALVPLNEPRAVELLPQAEQKARDSAESVLVSYYLASGKDARALELVRQMAVEHEMNYNDAITLMSHMTAGQESLRRDLFGEALASYSAHTHRPLFQSGDFTGMIARFYPQLPGPLVLQAVEEVLSQSKKADEAMAGGKGFFQVSFSAAKGDASFTSFYDQQLFALLPALRAADPVEADACLKQSALASELIGKYQNGLAELAPSSIDPTSEAGKKDHLRVSIMSGGGQQGARPPDPENRKQADIEMLIDEHPESALAQIAQLQASWRRILTYIKVAQEQWKKHPAIATEALHKALDEPDCPDDLARILYPNAAELYVKMDDVPSAKKVLEKAMVVVAKSYAQDTNADEPNIAPECFWPSTSLWLRVIRAGTKISPQWARELLKDAPNERVAGLGEVVVAASLLKVDYVAGNTIAIHEKGGESYSDGEAEKDGKPGQ